MKVHIVTEGNRIKMRISEKILKYNQTPIEYSLSYGQRNDVDINFYVCYNVFANFQKSKVKDIGYVTHVHNNSIMDHEKDLGKPFSLFNRLDGYLHMGSKTLKFFDSSKYNTVVYGGCELENFKPTITLGIMQNGEVVGKGTKFLIDLANSTNLDNFKFIFCGVGWESVLNTFKEKKIRYNYLTNTSYDNFQSVYEQIDYLLIPSMWEGGPMAVLEAMACKLPIISADTGWVREIAPGSLFFEPGKIEQLKTILQFIETRELISYHNVKDFSYKAFCDRLQDCFHNILNN